MEEDGAGKTEFCVFEMTGEAELLQFVDLFVKLMRRYKYVRGTDNMRVSITPVHVSIKCLLDEPYLICPFVALSGI